MANKVDSSLQVVLSLNKGQFINSVNQIKSNLSSLSNSFERVSKVAAAFGVGFGVYQLVQGFQKVVGTAIDFEQKMKLLQAVTGSTNKEMQSLAASALQLGGASLYSANQVAELQTALAKLGFSNTEIKNTTKAVIDLATATGEDLAKSADTVGSTLRGFNLSASESTRVADVMTAAFNKSALGVDNFAEAMKYVAANAAASNVSLEYTTATLGVLADAGLRGSIAGTALRKIFSELPKDGRPLQDRLQELADKGITLTDAFDEVGRTAQTALLLMVNNNDKLNGLYEGLKNVNGETERTARLVGDTAQGDLKRFGSALENLYIVGTNTGWFRGLISGLTEAARAMAGFGPSLSGLSSSIGLALKNAGRDGRGSDATFLSGIAEQYKKEFATLRAELGKPFDLRIADEVGARFGLSTEAITAFRKILEEVNPVLTDQEKILGGINKYLEDNGKNYKSTTEAVEAYRLEVAALYVENQKQLRDTLNESIGTQGSQLGDEFNARIAALRAQGLAYRGTIEGITAYADSIKKADVVTESSTKNIKKSAEEIAALKGSYADFSNQLNKVTELAQKTVNLTEDSSASRLRVFFSEIEALDRLKKKYEDLQKSFKFSLAFSPTNNGREFQPDSSQRQALDDQTVSSSADAVQDRVLERMKETTDAFAALKAGSIDTAAQVSLSWQQMSGSISNGVSDLIAAVFQADKGIGSFGDNIIRAVVNFAKQLGEILLASGIAALAAQELIINPYTAIIAGVALLAIAGAAQASISQAHQKTFGGSSATGGFSRSASQSRQNDFSASDQIILVGGSWELRGADLLLSLERAQKEAIRG